MEVGLSPQFQSYQGLHRVVTSKHRLQTHIENILEWLSNSKLDSDNLSYRSIRLLDTFFSDTLDDDLLGKIVLFAANKDFKIQILLLDPFSHFARSRAVALKQDAVSEVNRALFSIRNALRMANGKRAIGSLKHTDKFSEFQYLQELLQSIRDFSGKPLLEIRFYSVLTEVPVYIFSQFMGKGLILHDQSAAYNPWLMFVDDITQKNDIYDYLSDNFDAIWKDDSASDPKPQPNKPLISEPDAIFISHGLNEAVSLKIRNFLKENLDMMPILFEEIAKPGLTIVENLEVITRQCSKAIILMTKEDEQIHGGLRARQNVIHELGYCQALYGRDRVVLLLEEGVEIPSNISGILYAKFVGTNVEMCYEFLRKILFKQ